MKSIPLTQGKFTIVDDEDFEYLNQWKWRFDTGYATRSVLHSKKIYMHRVIMNTPACMVTDHINKNELDNRKENLRICSKAENSWNTKKPINNSSGYKGVLWHKGGKKWTAQIWCENKKIYLGLFSNLQDAIDARNEATIKYHKEFANIIK